MQRVTRIRGAVPLGVEQRLGTGFVLRFSSLFAQQAARALGQRRLGVVTFLAQRIGWIVMRADEVAGNLLIGTELYEVGDPGVLRGRRPAYFQRGIHALDCCNGVLVELEILGLGATPECFQIRFVPDFEVPVPYFGVAVARHPMRDQPTDQLRPLRIVLRRGDIGGVPEHGLVARRQRAGHETQFHERAHADPEYKVEDFVDVVERIEQCVVVLDQCAHVVGQQPVKTNTSESKLVVAAPELFLPVRAQGNGRVVATDHLFPEMRKRFCRSTEIARKSSRVVKRRMRWIAAGHRFFPLTTRFRETGAQY